VHARLRLAFVKGVKALYERVKPDRFSRLIKSESLLGFFLFSQKPFQNAVAVLIVGGFLYANNYL